MIIYGMRASPFVRKTLWFLAEKGIAHQVVPAGFGAGGEDFEKASPFRKFPAMVDGDFSLCDSSAIIAYAEALHPEPALIPAAPRSRARTVWFEEFGDTIMQPAIVPVFFNRVVARLLGRPADPARADEAERDAVPPVLDYLEGMIPQGGFLVDERLTLADLAVASSLINLDYASALLKDGRWPRTVGWLAAMKARPALAALLTAEAAQMRERVAAAQNNQMG
ncbi:glutathione S-transferase family protein [Sphingobium aquiterrae]|uniref:glutathione S-transferase family protein n=1 Tax=Sphingobium aquiterrae TaxID=2038656 RepID=UPI003019D47A